MKSWNDYDKGSAAMAVSATTAHATTPVRIMGYIFTPSATDCELHAYNATATSTDAGDMTIKTVVADVTVSDWFPSGVRFDTGLAVKAVNAPTTGIIFYVTE